MANETGSDAIQTLDRKIGWNKLLQAQLVVEAMVKESETDILVMAAERYGNVRKYAVQFLDMFSFLSSRQHDPLLSAIGMLKALNEDGKRVLPDKVPMLPLVERVQIADKPEPRRLYEIATLAELRDRLQSGDIWLEGSRVFRPIDEHLILRTAFEYLKQQNKLGLGVPRDGKLAGVRLGDGKLIVTPIASDVPTEADELNEELTSIYPMVEVPDLPKEVNDWTSFVDHFTHVRTGEPSRSIPAMLADATKLGPKRMATASKGISPHQISWLRLFHDRPETYRAVQACVTDAHSRHPQALLWG